MATYQFLTYVLPKNPIETKYSGIPKRLEIKHAEWDRYWENYNDEPEPQFEDVFSIKWWKGIPIDIIGLRNDIDKIIPRASWNNESWKIENGNVDHDVSIDFNEKERFIELFSFRTDLRDSTLVFLNSMLELCDRNDWVLMDKDGNLSEAKIQDLGKLVKKSPKYGFISNLDKFD